MKDPWGSTSEIHADTTPYLQDMAFKVMSIAIEVTWQDHE